MKCRWRLGRAECQAELGRQPAVQARQEQWQRELEHWLGCGRRGGDL